MSPILKGVVASGITGHLNTFTSTGNYEAIASYTVPSGGAASITFNAIPQDYKHLQIRATTWTDDTAASGLGNVRVYCYFNGDTTSSNYYSHYFYSTGGTPSSDTDTNSKFGPNSCRNAYIAPMASVMDIMDYSNPNKNKTARSFSGLNNNDTGNGLIRLTSGLWKLTNSITSIQFVPESGAYKQYSKFSIYGIRG